MNQALHIHFYISVFFVGVGDSWYIMSVHVVHTKSDVDALVQREASDFVKQKSTKAFGSGGYAFFS